MQENGEGRYPSDDFCYGGCNVTDESETTREAFIEAYVRRACAVGLSVVATGDGCSYLPDEEMPGGLRMIAVPCACEGHTEGWHMEEVSSP